MKANNLTQDKILNVAEELLSTRGYNAFSYKDISSLIGIKTSSIHYYYPSKNDLGVAIVEKKSQEMAIFLDELNNKNISAKKRLNLFVDSTLNSTFHDCKRMCVGGVLAIDALQMDKKLKLSVKKFFSIVESWIEKQLKELDVSNAKKEAKFIMALVEGSLLLSRLFDEQERLDFIKSRLVNIL